MLLRKSGTIERLSESGLPVGLLPNSTYKQGEINLEEGNTLLCMSDGIVEAANAQDELWAEKEVQNILSRMVRKLAGPCLHTVRQPFSCDVKRMLRRPQPDTRFSALIAADPF